MKALEIVREVQMLELPYGQYVVFGSCPMAAVGLRESDDIDLLFSDELHDMLVQKGWQEIPGKDGDRRLEFSHFDTHTSWKMGDYDPTLEDLLEDAISIDGIPFARLEEVRKWKAILARPKDIADIRLIDDWLEKAGRTVDVDNRGPSL